MSTCDFNGINSRNIYYWWRGVSTSAKISECVPYIHVVTAPDYRGIHQGTSNEYPQHMYSWRRSIQGPVVQNIVSLISSLVVKMLTVLLSKISNSQVFFWKKKKNVSSFCKCKSYSHFFSKNISKYAIFNNQSFNDTLTPSLVLNNWAHIAKRLALWNMDHEVPGSNIAKDKALFSSKKCWYLPYFCKKMLWVLIRSASPRHF